MTLRPITLAALLFSGLALTGTVLADEPAAAPAVPTQAQAIDPAAIRALARMGNYLRSLKSFSLQANDSTEELLGSGRKVQLLTTVELQARKPDRLRADVMTDRKARTIFYDGKNFTVYAPETGYYATVAAPPTIGEVLTAVEDKYDIEFPLADLFHWGEDTDAAAIQAATVVGTSKINGQVADHYAFSQEDVDWEVWIAQGDTPLPLRYVITTKDEEGQPQYVANLTWDIQAKLDDAVFSFTPGKDDHPIAILVVEEAPTSPTATQ